MVYICKTILFKWNMENHPIKPYNHIVIWL